MDIIKFDGCNITFAEDQPEYLPLPAHKTADGKVTSCWGLSWIIYVKIKTAITARILRNAIN